jgi:uncharacterized 2Fe-2S/4Fe-4S cluster protein (DUF4445 family)
MPEIIFSPSDKKGKLEHGRTVLSYIQELGISISASCGGCGICRGCFVKIDRIENLNDPTKIEKEFIKDQRYRLACQAKIVREIEDILVEIPEFRKYKILAKGKTKKIILNPFIKKKRSILGSKVFWENDEIDKYDGEIYGLALDIGTTTVSMSWINLETGHEKFTSSVLNPQMSYGDNVIDRINYARTKDQNHLRQALLDRINEMIMQGPVKSDHIYEIVAVGNSVMRDIFVDHSIASLGEAPFEPISKESVQKFAREIGIFINPKAKAYSLPLISHFVGADALAVILSTEMYECQKTTMAIDIGTNTEIAIGNKEKIIVTSCASGPAFEGSGIKCGTGAIEGAISQIVINSDLTIQYETIDDASPSGICGSGLIDILAEMLNRNIIDKKGKFSKGENKFTIKDNGKKIFIDGEDVDNLKLAKAAIYAGSKIVMKHYGAELKDIDTLYLAGAFGNYIDPSNAIKIGMLPDISLNKIERIGNAAIEGAKQSLTSKEKRKDAEEIPKKTKHIRLEMEEDFHDQFVNGLFFDKHE